LAATLTSALLALALAQGTATPPRATDGSTPSGLEAADVVATPTPPSTASEEDRILEGVAFIPSMMAGPQRSADGLFLDLALLSELRAQTLDISAGASSWTSTVEVTPGMGLELRTTRFTLSAGYAPRLTVPFNTGKFQLAVLNRATFQAAWQADPNWTLTALGLFVVGDNSQLYPASTPGGAGPPPPVLNPVRSFQTYPYVGIDTMLRVDGSLSPRTRLRLGGGYFDVGGVGAVGLANQPRTWGPQADAEFSWDPSRTATLSTVVKAQDWMMPGVPGETGTFDTILATATEAWKQAWTTELETTLAVGAGLSNRSVDSQTAAGHVVPVATLRLEYRERVRHPLHFGVEASLAPYFDPYQYIAYQRFTFGGTIDWRPSESWQLAARISAALAPYTVRAPESYGIAGVSANFAPLPFLILTAGTFGQAQFQGPSGTSSSFRQWTAYFSVALHDRIAF
jgi:hypothetical protein